MSKIWVRLRLFEHDQLAGKRPSMFGFMIIAASSRQGIALLVQFAKKM
jgi:hypothetical protein